MTWCANPGVCCSSSSLAIPRPDRAKAAKVDFGAIAGPVLMIAGGCDRIVPGRPARRTAARYQNVTYVEIPRPDHMVFYGQALPITVGHIDDWIARNDVLSTAWALIGHPDAVGLLTGEGDRRVHGFRGKLQPNFLHDISLGQWHPLGCPRRLQRVRGLLTGDPKVKYIGARNLSVT